MISVCVLFPDLLGTYGDGGNAVVLSRRMAWRGIEHEVVQVRTGDVVPVSCDIYLLGGGEDQPQSTVTDQLASSAVLKRAVDNGATVLAVCAGLQILGERFAISGGTKVGLGIADIETIRDDEPRRVGEVVARPDDSIGDELLTGYENHGGTTILGDDVRPLARVVRGHGNDTGDGTEGFVQGKVFGTYMHGPVLARNPQFADHLLGLATGEELSPLDDSEMEELRRERLSS